MTRPVEPAVHGMGIYKRYFDLIVTGRKTTEIRVNDSSRQIYPPEREALGVVAIGIELVDPPRPA